ncbi:histidinol-phosphate aminotransferase family protein [Methanoculleus sp. Wushi-C6]|uniref:Histidinol-phosphate aminotransferase family protein n=1 Tax=Methanoculleus caldifontis TaxID=2651577 RepID=A0ABU3X2Q2_9EURY|nr:histidinol-phosphate transaminase [Methanoculleus sp. Wushi-C6]MDV2482045.1 histidinol-phosphate aminotransferase family protein [Methanoculleus sp. Wushi-C6]
MRDNLPERMEHGGRVRWHRTREQGRLLDFSANVNPYPPEIPWNPDPSALYDYPDDRYEALKEEIGRAFGRGTDEIAVGNGSVELIRAFCSAVLGRGDAACIVPPTFAEYEMAVRLAGARCTPKEAGAAVRFLCNPNNPTGRLCSREEVLRLLSGTAARGSYLFLDEAFIELADPRQSVVDVRHENLFLLRSLTKSFAVPGIRFGYAFGTPELIARVETVRLPWTVNTFAEAFAIEAFRHYDLLRASRERIAREREWLSAGLESLCLTYEPPSANYILIEIPLPAELLVERLLSRGILVRDCRSFGLPCHIRVAVRTREENRQLIEALEACLP